MGLFKKKEKPMCQCPICGESKVTEKFMLVFDTQYHGCGSCLYRVLRWAEGKMLEEKRGVEGSR